MKSLGDMVSQYILVVETTKDLRVLIENTGGAAFLAGLGLDVVEVRSKDQLHDKIIEELSLGVRAYNCLKKAGCVTIGDILSNGARWVSAIPNMGVTGLLDVVEALGEKGLVFTP